MTELHHLTLAELNEGLRARRFSSVEITRHFLARIERLNPALNAVITVTAEQALAAAQRADRLLAVGRSGRAGGPADHSQGYFLHGRCIDHLRLAHVVQLRRAVRCDAGRATVAIWRRHARQSEHGRVRDGLVERNQLVRSGEKSLGPEKSTGGFVGRFRGCGGRANHACRDGHGYRRLDSPARGADRA